MLELTKQLIYTPEDYTDFNQTEKDWENKETPIVVQEVMDFYRQVVKNMDVFNEGGAEGAKRDFLAAWFQCNDDEFEPDAFGGNIEEGELNFRLSYAKTAGELGLEITFVELADILCPYDNLVGGRSDIQDLLF